MLAKLVSGVDSRCPGPGRPPSTPADRLSPRIAADGLYEGPASWSAALSHERVAREEAEDEQRVAKRQAEELQGQMAEVEAEREGL